MGQRVLVGAFFLVFIATACGPIKNKKSDQPEDLISLGFNSGFSGAIYFDNKSSYQRLDMRSGLSENFLASAPKMTSPTIGADQFVSVKRSRSYPELLVLGRDKQPTLRIPLPENPDGTPRLSHNGQFVLIGGIAGDTKIYNLNGQVVANLRTNISSYDWLPDGKILFSKFGTIYKMETDFKTVNVYHQMAGAISGLSVSPDGSRLAFGLKKTGSNTHIYILDMGSEILRQITTSTSAEHFPAWEPNGGHLVIAKGKLVEQPQISTGSPRPQNCLELWIVNANAEKVSDLAQEDLANTYKVKQSKDGQTVETCATSAPAWRSQ